MKDAGNARDDRWRGVLAVSLVGCIVTLCLSLAPPEGWTVAGHEFRLVLPPAWSFAVDGTQSRIVIPRKKPSDIEDLLARYDSGWAAATQAEPHAVAAEVPTDTAGIFTHGQGVDEFTASSAAGATAGLDDDTIGASRAAWVETASVDSEIHEESSTPTPSHRRSSHWTVPDAGALPSTLKLVIPEAAREAFGQLFSNLVEHGDVTVLHYGDSQIEGDRISGVMRNAWQERWGGYGPGLQAAVPLVPSFAVRQSHTGAWRRHTRYGRRDTTDVDERYGLMACYAAVDTVDTPGVPAPPKSCLSIAQEPRNHPQFSRWKSIRIWHDSITTSCSIALNGHAMDTLLAGTPSGTLTLQLPSRSAEGGAIPTEICFGGVPPRIHALEPIGGGVQWHNVPMRGSSGTLFRKLDRPQFSEQLMTLGPDLVILQFGGNYVPHCPPDGGAARYGGWFASQIRLFKRLLPQSAILVIGPSDMAEKTGLEWTPFTMLDEVRLALRTAAREEGVAYWDLLEVMGGLGSMPAWVGSEPPLAGPDHIHFTPLGARKVGTLLDRAFLTAYGDWQRQWSPPAPDAIGSRRAPTLDASSPNSPPPSLHVRQ